MAHAAYKGHSYGEKKALECDHCKMKGHMKDKCWTLHPHLKPMRLRENGQGSGQGQRAFAGTTTVGNNELVRKSDLEALIKSISKLVEQGNGLFVSKSNDKVIVDSGASHHMISNGSMLKDMKSYVGNVRVANGKDVPIKGIGNLEVFRKNTKALYVPDFTSNLLSVHKATKDLNCKVIFGSDMVQFQDNKTKKVFGEGGVRDGLYLLNKEDDRVMESYAVSMVGTSSLWHSRLGHPSQKVLSMILPNLIPENKDCEACVLGKHCRNPFPDSKTSYDKCFDLVHSDVWSAPCVSKDQYKYFVSFIDEKSKYTWLTLMSSKSQVFESFVRFYNYVLNQFNTRVKVLRSDNGGEYMSDQFKRMMESNGIIHQTSCAYTPQQNGVSERKNRHLMEVARSIMFERGVPKRFWGDAVMTSAYLINRLPTPNLGNKSPYEVLNGTKPNIDHIRVFGCRCYVFVPESQRNKLEPRSIKCMFVGYSSTQKGYKCYHPDSNRIYVSRDVKFDEAEGYFTDKRWEDLDGIMSPVLDQAQILKSIIIEEEGTNSAPMVPNSGGERNEEESLVEESSSASSSAEPSSSDEKDEESSGTLDNDEGIREDEVENVSDSEPILRRSQRQKFPSQWKNPKIYFNGQATVQHPIQAHCSMAYLPEEHQIFLSQVDKGRIPTSYEEACGEEVWVKAMEEEIESMRRNNTWDIIKLPKGKKLVGCRWVYTIKYKSNGEIERYKARLVAKGYTQVFGEDYTETFAPVAKLHSVRVLLSLAINLSWGLWQMDVKNAFLQGDLEEEVYMASPQGYHDENGGVCKLRKAIYGLKQSPRAWYQRLSTCLINEGYLRSEADHTLFTKFEEGKGIVAILVYVDDIIITGNNVEGIEETKKLLKIAFDIKDLGVLKYFLGIEMSRFEDGMFITQRKYVLDLLSETGKIGSRPAKTPIEEGYQDHSEGEPWPDVKQYQRLVGKLIYLTITRPDICFAVNRVSQHMKAPSTHHWHMVERILRYLKGCPGKGIWLGCNKSTELRGFCDADWAGDKRDRKSTTGYCTFVGGNLVTWRSKKQKVVSLSSAEAEYRAMKDVTKELIWLRTLLRDLGIHETKPIVLHCDNQAAIHIASNPVFHERTKHIEIDCHFVRDKIQEGFITPMFIKSEDQVADVLTKATRSNVCQYLHGKIGLKDLHKPTLRGSIEKTKLECGVGVVGGVGGVDGVSGVGGVGGVGGTSGVGGQSGLLE